MHGIILAAQMFPAEWAESVADKGITAVLLIIFVGYFIRRSKNDDNKVKEAYETSQKNMEEQNKAVREREDYLLAESAKREEILRDEADRREKLIRAEAEKRESILMASMDRMLDTLDNIADTLSNVERSVARQDQRLDAIEKEIRNGPVKSGGS